MSYKHLFKKKIIQTDLAKIHLFAFSSFPFIVDITKILIIFLWNLLNSVSLSGCTNVHCIFLDTRRHIVIGRLLNPSNCHIWQMFKGLDIRMHPQHLETIHNDVKKTLPDLSSNKSLRLTPYCLNWLYHSQTLRKHTFKSSLIILSFVTNATWKFSPQIPKGDGKMPLLLANKTI